MTRSAAVGKDPTQLSLTPVQPRCATLLSDHEPNDGQLLEVRGHRGLAYRHRGDDFPDRHWLPVAGSSETICTRVPSASALNQAA